MVHAVYNQCSHCNKVSITLHALINSASIRAIYSKTSEWLASVDLIIRNHISLTNLFDRLGSILSLWFLISTSPRYRLTSSEESYERAMIG